MAPAHCEHSASGMQRETLFLRTVGRLQGEAQAQEGLRIRRGINAEDAALEARRDAGLVRVRRAGERRAGPTCGQIGR